MYYISDISIKAVKCLLIFQMMLSFYSGLTFASCIFQDKSPTCSKSSGVAKTSKRTKELRLLIYHVSTALFVCECACTACVHVSVCACVCVCVGGVDQCVWVPMSKHMHTFVSATVCIEVAIFFSLSFHGCEL